MRLAAVNMDKIVRHINFLLLPFVIYKFVVYNNILSLGNLTT